MKERVPWIAEWESGELSMAALCRKYGVSRQPGHKWTHRYEEGDQDIDSLRHRSRAPHCHPWTTPRGCRGLAGSRTQAASDLGSQEDLCVPAARMPAVGSTRCERDRFDPEAVRDDEGAPSSTTHADEPGRLGATRSASECRVVHGLQRSAFDGRRDRRVSAHVDG
ncbi:MAG: hypothetical protein H6832_04700 [Planctomycetes bacterium]|nr:hypothetical protein [Planctomycetota bacterium]MCB9917680.1 hypothetical protein [Planctomycetota bacterium]